MGFWDNHTKMKKNETLIDDFRNLLNNQKKKTLNLINYMMMVNIIGEGSLNWKRKAREDEEVKLLIIEEVVNQLAPFFLV